jgi:peptide/nickel transport system substrate-binding protein
MKREDSAMRRRLPNFAATCCLLLVALIADNSASAQKYGGILKLYDPDSPANMSMLESPTFVSEMPLMGVFNNLVLFDQHSPQVSLHTIIPDLATSWSWSEDGTALTFALRHDVKWHDGKPFTAADVKCTWDLLLDKAP